MYVWQRIEYTYLDMYLELAIHIYYLYIKLERIKWYFIAFNIPGTFIYVGGVFRYSRVCVCCMKNSHIWWYLFLTWILITITNRKGNQLYPDRRQNSEVGEWWIFKAFYQRLAIQQYKYLIYTKNIDWEKPKRFCWNIVKW